MRISDWSSDVCSSDLAVASILPPAYIYYYANDINLRIAQIDPVLPVHIVFGLAIVALLLEAVRRAVAPALMIIAGIMVLYLFTCDYLPGVLHYRDIPVSEIVEGLYLSATEEHTSELQSLIR